MRQQRLRLLQPPLGIPCAHFCLRHLGLGGRVTQLGKLGIHAQQHIPRSDLRPGIYHNVRHQACRSHRQAGIMLRRNRPGQTQLAQDIRGLDSCQPHTNPGIRRAHTRQEPEQ